MKRELPWFVVVLASALIALPGCLLVRRDFTFDQDLPHYETVATEIEYPNVAAPSDPGVLDQAAPRTIEAPEPAYWDLTLQEAIHLALVNSEVMRDLGGTVLRAPESVKTPYGPAIEELDPQFGVEAALSAFDAEFATSMFFEKNDRRLNNRFLGEGGFYEQDYDTFQAQLTKRAATGSQFALRKNIEFDNDNNLGNEFPNGAWTVFLDAEARHPLLQGSGVKFNRIAGPGGRPGVVNGVLVARVKTDISLVDFEAGLRNLIADVENAYWDLYFAYRHLDAKRVARDGTLEAWRKVYALYSAGRRGGEADKEGEARDQYYRLQEETQNALVGRLLEGTRTSNGSSGGTFYARGFAGVHVNERKLRLLLGLPPNGDRLIRPADEPLVSPVVFDWGEIVTEAMVRRAELRRQRWQIKKSELELIASRNFLLPNLDLVGRYRWRGFGEDLLDSHRPGRPRFDNAFMDLTSGKFQEWQLGVEFSVPIGFRQAHASVENAELRLARDRAVLREQERQVVHDLSNAVAELHRAYAVLQTNYNRAVGAGARRESIAAVYDKDTERLSDYLRAQNAWADAESAYDQAMVEYALALRNVHFEKGSLLEYCGVGLSEGPWPSKAYSDAAERDRLRGRPRPINYALDNPPIVSQGPYVPTASLGAVGR